MGTNHCSLDSPGRSGVFRTCRKCLLSVCDGGAEMLVLPLWARCEHPGASRTVQGTMGPNHCCLDSKFGNLLFRTWGLATATEGNKPERKASKRLRQRRFCKRFTSNPDKIAVCTRPSELHGTANAPLKNRRDHRSLIGALEKIEKSG